MFPFQNPIAYAINTIVIISETMIANTNDSQNKTCKFIFSATPNATKTMSSTIVGLLILGGIIFLSAIINWIIRAPGMHKWIKRKCEAVSFI